MKIAQPYVDSRSPFYEALSEFLRVGLDSLKAQERWAKRDPETDRQATVSEAFDIIVSRIYFYGMLRYGLYYRMVKERLEAEPSLKRCYRWVLRRIDLLSEEFSKLSDYHVIPIRNLVGVQLSSVLYAILHL